MMCDDPLIVDKQDALHARVAELEAAVRLRDDFLAGMNHALRTPLTAILGLTEALQLGLAGPLTTDQRQFVDDLMQSCQHLQALVCDVLELAKIDAGHLEPEPMPTDIDALCAGCLRLLMEPSRKRGQHLRMTVDPRVSHLAVDPRFLKRMLVSLLGIAIKRTPTGGAIHLAVDGAPDTGLVHFAVQDAGPAGATDALAEERLALTLTERLAARHGGTLDNMTVSLPWVAG
jgi:signal transduction histidine kinase